MQMGLCSNSLYCGLPFLAGLSDPEGYCMHLDEDDAPIGMVKRVSQQET